MIKPLPHLRRSLGCEKELLLPEPVGIGEEGSERMPVYSLHSQLQEQKGRSLTSIQGLGQESLEDKQRLHLVG